MKLSTDRILTTHVGSLPRRARSVELLYQEGRASRTTRPAFVARSRGGGRGRSRNQVAVGIDVVSDGEAGKVGYATYVKDRLSGSAVTIRDRRISTWRLIPKFADAMVQCIGKRRSSALARRSRRRSSTARR